MDRTQGNKVAEHTIRPRDCEARSFLFTEDMTSWSISTQLVTRRSTNTRDLTANISPFIVALLENTEGCEKHWGTLAADPKAADQRPLFIKGISFVGVWFDFGFNLNLH